MKLLFSALLAALTSKNTNAAQGFYTYFEESGFGPNHWAFVDAENNQCGSTYMTSGYGQSPVPIYNKDQCDTDMSAYTFTGGDCTWEDLKFGITKNGVEVVKGDNCSFGTMKIPHTPNEFNALQFHVHASSEHTIEGSYYEAELHVVHQESTGESFAVFGTMISSGADAADHAMFENFLRGWEKVANAAEATCAVPEGRRLAEDFVAVQQKITCPAVGSGAVEELAFVDATAAVSVYDLPTDQEFGVYTYKGGLTTPPCTEAVNWNLLDTPMMISTSQMDRLMKLILCFVDTETCNHATVASYEGSTSRPPQMLLGREIVHRCRTCDSCETIVDSAPIYKVLAEGGPAAPPADQPVTAPTGGSETIDKDQVESSEEKNVGFAIGMFAIGMAAILIAFIAYHMFAMKAAKNESRKSFALRVAQGISVGKSANQLPTEGMKAELSQYGEHISRAQLKNIIDSGKMGTMSDGDFNALFAALDLGNGSASVAEVRSLISVFKSSNTVADTSSDEES